MTGILSYISYPTWLHPEIIPGLPLRWYGLMYLVAFAITYLLFNYQVKQRKLNIERDTVMNFFFWGIVGLLIGARLFATLIFDSTGRYLLKPWLIFWPFDENFRFTGFTGMNYYGGLVGAVVACIIYTRVKKLDFFDWADMLVAGIPLGYTFGRFGNFINGELYGRLTTAPWGMIFPNARSFPASESWVVDFARKCNLDISQDAVMVNLPRHPSQLYEAFLEGIFLWLVIWFIFRKRRPFQGFLLGVYIISYGLVRFFVDYFRIPLGKDFAIKLSSIENPPYLLLTPWNFLASQIFSILMILGGGILLILLYMYWKRREAITEKPKVSMRKLRKKIGRE
jgi:phosphatidylglycerol:prolipoprotein diacylglycerol transferase